MPGTELALAFGGTYTLHFPKYLLDNVDGTLSLQPKLVQTDRQKAKWILEYSNAIYVLQAFAAVPQFWRGAEYHHGYRRSVLVVTAIPSHEDSCPDPGPIAMAQLRTTRMPDLWWLSNNVVYGILTNARRLTAA
ncbi:MAG: hypothetical protein Q9195_008749 [Heterodermia aff. obscurata]